MTTTRTKFVVSWMALLVGVSWFMSLGRLIGIQFWNQQHALDEIEDSIDECVEAGSGIQCPTPIQGIAESYFTERRYVFFLPHVLGALIWWNMYFIQLFPSIRHKYKRFHRVLGRVLFLTAIAQVISGLGLALGSHSPIIKLVSFLQAIAVVYCVVWAFYYAYNRDIPRHKFWVYRLVGYSHTIVLQRFFLLTVIILRQMGVTFLEPDHYVAGEDPSVDITYEMFDQSFVLAIVTAFMVTEWYLSGELLNMEGPAQRSVQSKQAVANEGTPLLSS